MRQDAVMRRLAALGLTLLTSGCPGDEPPTESMQRSRSAGVADEPSAPAPPLPRASAGVAAEPPSPTAPSPASSELHRDPVGSNPAAATDATHPAVVHRPRTMRSAPMAPHAGPPRTAEPERPGRGSNPLAFPRGAAVGDAGRKIEAVRQLIDGLAQDALLHASKMSGEAPDPTGSIEVDLEDEHRQYVAGMRKTHRSMRKLMRDVARCPEADPERPVSNRSAPVNQLREEIDRYGGSRPSRRQAEGHVERLRPLVVRWKSVYIDPAEAERASEPSWPVPRDLKTNWCP